LLNLRLSRSRRGPAKLRDLYRAPLVRRRPIVAGGVVVGSGDRSVSKVQQYADTVFPGYNYTLLQAWHVAWQRSAHKTHSTHSVLLINNMACASKNCCYDAPTKKWPGQIRNFATSGFRVLQFTFQRSEERQRRSREEVDNGTQ
jgi:hypothetical protein